MIRNAKQAMARLPGLGAVARSRAASRKADTETTPPLCESVLEWAIAHPGTPYRRLEPPVVIPKAPPSTLEPSIHPKFLEATEVPVAERYVVELHDAVIELPRTAEWPPRSWAHGLDYCPRVVLPDGTVSVESTQRIIRRCLPVPVDEAARMDGDYLSLIGPYSWDGNYGHWLHDVFTRLCGVIDLLPADTRFVVPPLILPHHLDTLAMLGIGRDRLVTFDVGDAGSARSWQLERLWFSPGPIGPTASPTALSWIRDLGLASLDAEPAPPHRLLYLSRRQTRYRRVVNEDEVTAYLVGRGFEIHTPEDYTLHEQIALFAEAAVVMGPNGAAHTNIVFSPPGLALVAIHGTDVDKFFHNMCLALGHDYWYMLGEDAPSGHGFAGDVVVPLDELDRVTTAVLERHAR